MALLKVYRGTFQKQNGELREMRFVKLDEAPPHMLPGKNAESKPRQFADGAELVWDLDNEGYRVFNWTSIEGVVVVETIDIDKLR